MFCRQAPCRLFAEPLAFHLPSTFPLAEQVSMVGIEICLPTHKNKQAAFIQRTCVSVDERPSGDIVYNVHCGRNNDVPFDSQAG